MQVIGLQLTQSAFLEQGSSTEELGNHWHGGRKKKKIVRSSFCEDWLGHTRLSTKQVIGITPCLKSKQEYAYE